MNTKEKRPQFATPSAKTKIRKNPYRKSSAVKELERLANEAARQNFRRSQPNGLLQENTETTPPMD